MVYVPVVAFDGAVLLLSVGIGASESMSTLPGSVLGKKFGYKAFVGWPEHSND
jgi:hypothetical protein